MTRQKGKQLFNTQREVKDSHSDDKYLWHHGIHYFCDDFDNETTKPVIKWILEQNLTPKSERPEELTLIINSYGGDSASCFALIEVMKGSKIPVKTIGIGIVASCGILALMSGHKGRRFITPTASILSHQYSSGSYGKDHELLADQKIQHLTRDKILRHYKKCTGLSEKKIKELLLPASDVWLTAEEAVEYGVADEIRTLY